MAGRLPLDWGTTQADLGRRYPADTMLDGPILSLTRAIDVAAPPELLWRWLCQIAVAPYSYDLLDNLGRQSPRELGPGTDDLEIGQRMMIFELTEFEPGHSWTGITLPGAARWFGDVSITYAAESGPRGSRLVCRMTVSQRGAFQWARARFLAWGDLVMMRKQLLTLKELAERDALAAQPGSPQ